MNQLDNFEEYENPILYDQENDPFQDDVKLLQKWALKVNGPIIDLACGTGRATIPLAEAGHTLIGVDIHKGMLTQAKRKTEQTNLNIEWMEQDCTNLQLGVKSPLIYIVGNSFQHFLTNEEQDQLLGSVHNHLEQEGIFIFGTRFPSPDELLQPATEEYWRSYKDETGKMVDVYTISNYDTIQQVQHYMTIRRQKDENGKMIDEKKTNIKLRYVYPQEMDRLLKGNGFEILAVYKDWHETPLTEDSHQMIYVCRKVEA
ncbi:class I SAM-dependent methyltransferase [Bacillus sp. REN16]|uniref:class I SAM-dependent methyltransferase n=1 Tax=Bacillus sp. REN16 TaxID=2887296 RepID=UPI001E58588F|nr:class I SAM-dependent methyltransferase [Bacillus sp. REN16]MCC3356050.1 class I SAM-dependent methyltransferase [Bacillus sp. REN16]